MRAARSLHTYVGFTAYRRCRSHISHLHMLLLCVLRACAGACALHRITSWNHRPTDHSCYTCRVTHTVSPRAVGGRLQAGGNDSCWLPLRPQEVVRILVVLTGVDDHMQ